jgi:hypothetical protein
MSNGLPIIASYTFNSMGYTTIEAFYNFIRNTNQGCYLYENAYLASSTVSEMDAGLRQQLITSWNFFNKEAETFYVLKWFDQ